MKYIFTLLSQAAGMFLQSSATLSLHNPAMIPLSFLLNIYCPFSRQIKLAICSISALVLSSYALISVNTQRPWFSAKNTPNCIRIWNHTQKYYESKSRQALPDGVFGHFKARKSYAFILL